MTENRVERVQIALGTSDDGKFVAASLTSPFFCFEADSEDETLDKVRDALSFYTAAREAQPIVANKKINTITRLLPQKVLTYEDGNLRATA